MTSNAATPTHVAARLRPFGTSVFAEMTELARRHDAINLGQGFPDFDGPDAIREAAVAAIRSGRNQYSRMAGVPELAAAVADHQRGFHGLEYDALDEITVTSGATEAIFATLLGLLDPGDDLVLFAPFYDSYRASVAMAGATARPVRLDPPDFALDTDALAAALTPRTRGILINTPHNPTGKVWTRNELAAVAEVARERNLVVISDEVYEHLVFTGEHVPIASLPGMRERTVTISSTGKTFSFTGWKVGYACAPPELTRAVRAAHQFVTFCAATPLQWSMVTALRLPPSYYDDFLAAYRGRRERLGRGLEAAGFDVLWPAGTYFIVADARPLGFDDGDRFCRELPARVGVAAVPVAAFHDDPGPARPLVRFAFCKQDATLDEAVRRLAGLRTEGVVR